MADLFAGAYFTVVLDKDNSNDGIYVGVKLGE
jgi:hypothetical protein